MDKLKYVKIENEDGSLSDNIPLGVDAENVDTNNGSTVEIELNNLKNKNNSQDNLINNLNDKINIQDNSINNLQSQVNGLASGSPLVASSVAEMTDTSKVYVNTTDGHWYYYNNTSWVDGGVYQATEIADEAININNVRDELKKINGIGKPEYSLTNGYIGYRNNETQIITDVSGYNTSSPIKLLKNQTVVFTAKGYETNVFMISTCDEFGENLSGKVKCLNSNLNKYSYTAEDDCYVRLSGKTSNFAEFCYIYGNFIRCLYDNSIDFNLLSTFLNNDVLKISAPVFTENIGYISYKGNIVTDDPALDYRYTSPFKILKNQTIKFNGRGYETRVAMISTCDENGENITPKTISYITERKDYSYTAEEDSYIILSYYRRTYSNGKIYFSLNELNNLIISNTKNNEIIKNNIIDENKNPLEIINKNIGYISIFNKIACIGDSITERFF